MVIGVEVGACLQTSDLRAALQRLILSQLRNGLRALQSLWHLSEADFNLNVDRSEHEQVFGRWYKKGSDTIKESATYLFGTLLPPTRVAAEVA